MKNSKTEIISIHESFRDAIKSKYDLLLKALEQDKKIIIKWNEKEKELRFFIQEAKRIWEKRN